MEHALQKPDSVLILSLGDYRIDGDSVRYFIIDSTIQRFENLEELKFTCNRIKTIPEEIANLKKLREVTITDEQNMSATTNNCVLNFSDTFQKLSRVESLFQVYIPYVKLNQTQELSYLSNISVLSLVYNKITSLPEELSEMKSLKAIDIRYNKLKNLPNSISDLNYLHTLDFTHNDFKVIPNSVFEIEDLEYLNFSYNEIEELSQRIGELKSLKSLDLRGNLIEEIPKELFNCINLETLDLSNNRIDSIPDEIIKLEKLKVLHISGNNFSQEEIDLLKNKLGTVEIMN